MELRTVEGNMDGQGDLRSHSTSPGSENYGGLVDSSTAVTFRDLGIVVNPTTRRTIFGKVQTFQGLTFQERLFLVIAVISFLTSIGLTIERLISLDKASDDYTFAILLCVATVFCFCYAVGGIFLERPFELLVCVISTIIVAIYTVLNYIYGVQGIVKLVRMVLALCYGVALVITGSKIGYEYHISRDLILRTVGANLQLQSACNILFMTSSLLGFDLQLGISMIIFVMTSGITLSVLEQIVLGVGVPFSVLWLLFGYFSLRLESKLLVALFILSSWAEPAYVIYKFTEINHEDKILRYSTVACGGTALVVRILLIIFTLLAVRNFNLGLKGKVYGSQTPRSGSVVSG